MTPSDLDDRIRTVGQLARRTFDADEIADLVDMPPDWVRRVLKDLVRLKQLEEEPDGHYRAPRLKASAGMGADDRANEKR